mmetsp:Transcript_7745/g.19183  ORF Transcript_7745/g.19183 Transcript_7745/m.19183 type:complete len:121 (-) Transcript_7745:325-687(-)
MFSAKEFLKTYGTIGISVYAGATAVSVGSFYLLLRTGRADRMITAPLERILGNDSEFLQRITRQLGEANQQQEDSGNRINYVREGTYLGIASAVDSLISPMKMAVCLPIAKYIIRVRAGR